MSTRQQEIWMAMAVAESDGSAEDIQRRFTRKVTFHPGAFQIPQLDADQQKTLEQQALHDVFAMLGCPLDEDALAVFERETIRREQELGHIMRQNLLHPVIQNELWVRRVTGRKSA